MRSELIRVAGAQPAEPRRGRLTPRRIGVAVAILAAAAAVGVILALVLGSSKEKTPDERLASLLSHNRFVQPRDARVLSACRFLARPGVGVGAVQRKGIHAIAAMRCTRRQSEATFYLFRTDYGLTEWFEEPVAQNAVLTTPCNPAAEKRIRIQDAEFSYREQRGFCLHSPRLGVIWSDHARKLGVVWTTSRPNNGRLLSQWVALGVPG